jgi:hypothetical protein
MAEESRSTPFCISSILHAKNGAAHGGPGEGGGRNRWNVPQERRVGYPAQELREASCPIHGGRRSQKSERWGKQCGVWGKE